MEPSTNNVMGAQGNRTMFSSAPIFRYNHDKNAWQEAPAATNPPSIAIQTLKIVTWNTLFDIYDADKLFTERRTPLLLEILQRCNADIIGLQEIRPKVLAKILAQPWVRDNYYVSEDLNISNDTCSRFGQIILSRWPFRMLKYSFSQYKKVIVAELTLNNRQVFIPCIHLTSSSERNSDYLGKRMRQLETIFDRVCPPITIYADGSWTTMEDGTDAILIGDFNFGDSEENNLLRADLRDAWTLLRPNDPGFTVDPTRNRMAEITAHNRRRYDRVLIRGARWEPESIRLLGQDSTMVTLDDENTKVELYPSDHFGVECTIRWLDETDVAIKNVLTQAGMIESDEGNERRSKALATLNRLFTQWLVSERAAAPSGNVLPLGSYAYGVHSAGGDIDILCVADRAASVFFDSFPKFLLSKRAQEQIDRVRVVTDALVPVVKISISGIKIDILYCALPEGQIPRSNINFHVADELLAAGKAYGDDSSVALRALSDQSIMSLNGWRDTQIVLSCIKSSADLFSFRQAHRVIRLWAQRRGVYSNTLCYLGGFGWTVLLAYAMQDLRQRTEAGVRISASQLIRHFFTMFSAWNWKTEPISIVPAALSSYKMDSVKDVVTVLTPTRPYRNSARNFSRSTRTVLKNELARAHSILSENGANLTGVLLRQLCEPIAEIFSGPDHYKSFLKIVVSALNEVDFNRWQGFIESRIVALVIKLDMGGVLSHIIPKAFANPESPFPFSCFYLIGLKKFQQAGDASSSSSTQQSQENKLDFANSIYQFEDMIKKWESKNDQMDLLIKHIKAEALHADQLVAQLSQQGSISSSSSSVIEDEIAEEDHEEADGSNSFSGSEEDEQEKPVSPVGAKSASAKKAGTKASDDKKKAKKTTKKKGAEEEPAKKKKIRHSLDVFNRIKWDPQLSRQNWVVGYEDRFVGIIEVPVAEFDHSTIPWHRVRIFKLDGEIMWDRTNKIDKVFGENEEDEE